MFRARLAQLALVAGLGLVTGCTSCYSFSLGAPATGGGGGGLFSRLHQNSTPAPVNAGLPVTPGCGCAASPCCDGPLLDGYGGMPGMGYSAGPGAGFGNETMSGVMTAPHLVPAPAAPVVPYAP